MMKYETLGQMILNMPAQMMLTSDLDIAFDVLDSAVHNALLSRNNMLGWIDAERQQVTSGSAEFELYEEPEKYIGRITLLKLGASTTRMTVDYPPRFELADFSDQEKADWTAKIDREPLDVVMGEIHQASLKRTAAQHAAKKARLEEIIQRLKSVLDRDYGPLFSTKSQDDAGSAEEKAPPEGSTGDPASAPPVRPNWFPKTKKTLDKWKRGYQKIQDTRRNFQVEYDDSKTDVPNPNSKDLITAVATLPDWPNIPSVSTVDRIRIAGDNGWLD